MDGAEAASPVDWMSWLPPTGIGPPGRRTGTDLVKRGLAEMLRGGVIMDVVTAEQAKIAEDAGAVVGDGAGAGAGRHPP